MHICTEEFISLFASQVKKTELFCLGSERNISNFKIKDKKQPLKIVNFYINCWSNLYRIFKPLLPWINIKWHIRLIFEKSLLGILIHNPWIYSLPGLKGNILQLTLCEVQGFVEEPTMFNYLLKNIMAQIMDNSVPSEIVLMILHGVFIY